MRSYKGLDFILGMGIKAVSVASRAVLWVWGGIRYATFWVNINAGPGAYILDKKIQYFSNGYLKLEYFFDVLTIIAAIRGV